MRKIEDEFSHIKSASERWRLRNPEYTKNRYRANKERLIEESKAWADKNPDKTRQYKSSYKQRNRMQTLLDAARKRAREKSLPCSITMDDIIVPEFCPILGIKLEHGVGTQTNNSPSIDRVIPELGYVRGNIRVISYQANRYKSNMTRDLFVRFLDYIDGKI